MVNIRIKICRTLNKTFYMLDYLVPKLNILLRENFRDSERPHHSRQLTVAQKYDILVFDTSAHETFENLGVELGI